MRYAILTFGCRVNQAESLALGAGLRARGGRASEPREADLVVVNSCSVTANADQGTRQAIRKVARENPGARIVVTGCYATRQPAEVAGLPGVVAVVPNERKDGLAASPLVLSSRTLGTTGDEWSTAERDAGSTGSCGAPFVLRPGDAGRTAFTLRVQTGCEESCAYCVIPATRGAARSTPVAALVAEGRRIEEAGYREVTLTGVHLGAYGRDLTPRATLTDLLGRLIEGTDHLVFRLGSLEPMDCPAAIVDLAAVTGRLAPSFHLPLQHASDRILGAMRRPYTATDYAAMAARVRERLPHAAITADVIAGFPGEGDEDVDRLASYLESSPITQLHVFPYSDRPGTEASRLPGKVHGAIVRARCTRLRNIGHGLAARFRTAQAGRHCRALTIEDGRTAVTDNGLHVAIGEGHPRNEVLTVRLALDEDGRLTGHPTRSSSSWSSCSSW